jgi:hypothetical protein
VAVLRVGEAGRHGWEWRSSLTGYRVEGFVVELVVVETFSGMRLFDS